MPPSLVIVEKLICQVLGVPTYRYLRSRASRQKKGFEELELLNGILIPESRGGVMVDVGAHFGESFKMLAYHGWDVLAVEPDPNPSKHRMIKARSTARVQAIRCALSNVAGQQVPFYVSDESTGVSTMSPFLESHRLIDQVVETDTLSNVLHAYLADRQVDFLKIDTEGYDWFVLQGLDWSNSQQRPRAILCEFEDKKTLPLGYGYQQLGDFLIDQGYQVWLSEWKPITTYGVAHQWRSIDRYPCRLADASGWGNFIAVDASLSKQLEKAIEKMVKRP